MIQFSAPVSSVRFRLNTFIVVRNDFINTKYTCTIIESRVLFRKLITTYIFEDSGGDFYRATDWGDGKIYYMRKMQLN